MTDKSLFAANGTIASFQDAPRLHKRQPASNNVEEFIHDLFRVQLHNHVAVRTLERAMTTDGPTRSIKALVDDDGTACYYTVNAVYAPESAASGPFVALEDKEKLSVEGGYLFSGSDPLLANSIRGSRSANVIKNLLQIISMKMLSSLGQGHAPTP